jgi:hypothetical protein
MRKIVIVTVGVFIVVCAGASVTRADIECMDSAIAQAREVEKCRSCKDSAQLYGILRSVASQLDNCPISEAGRTGFASLRQRIEDELTRECGKKAKSLKAGAWAKMITSSLEQMQSEQRSSPIKQPVSPKDEPTTSPTKPMFPSSNFLRDDRDSGNGRSVASRVMPQMQALQTRIDTLEQKILAMHEEMAFQQDILTGVIGGSVILFGLLISAMVFMRLESKRIPESASSNRALSRTGRG